MESPFSQFKNNSTFVLYLEPILNPYYKAYQNVITLDRMPDGPLAELVTIVNLPKLSPFQEAGVFSSPNFGRAVGGSCVHVLMRYKNTNIGTTQGFNWKTTDAFMCADDIPSVFGYLKANGYKIDTDTTKMLFKSKVDIGGVSDKRFSGNRKLICMVEGTH